MTTKAPPGAHSSRKLRMAVGTSTYSSINAAKIKSTGEISGRGKLNVGNMKFEPGYPPAEAAANRFHIASVNVDSDNAFDDTPCQPIEAVAAGAADDGDRFRRMLSYGKFKFVRQPLRLPDFRERHVRFVFRQRDCEPRVAHFFCAGPPLCADRVLERDDFSSNR